MEALGIEAGGLGAARARGALVGGVELGPREIDLFLDGDCFGVGFDNFDHAVDCIFLRALRLARSRKEIEKAARAGCARRLGCLGRRRRRRGRGKRCCHSRQLALVGDKNRLDEKPAHSKQSTRATANRQSAEKLLDSAEKHLVGQARRTTIFDRIRIVLAEGPRTLLAEILVPLFVEEPGATTSAVATEAGATRHGALSIVGSLHRFQQSIARPRRETATDCDLRAHRIVTINHINSSYFRFFSHESANIVTVSRCQQSAFLIVPV